MKITSKWRAGTVLMIALLFLIVPTGLAKQKEKPVEFTDVEKQTREFIGYYHSIQLNAEQKQIKERALSKIPAPCCDEYTQATCCCPCNLAKSVWGLSNYLIANHNSNEEQVRSTVLEWTRFINPSGFDGNVCQTGRCRNSFEKGGCGGMNEADIVF